MATIHARIEMAGSPNEGIPCASWSIDTGRGEFDGDNDREDCREALRICFSQLHDDHAAVSFDDECPTCGAAGKIHKDGCWHNIGIDE